MLSKTEILNFLSRQKDYLRENFDVVSIGVFGSFARDEQDEDSDIDILVQFDANTTNLFEKRLDLKEYLESKFHRHVDICHKCAIKPVFRDLILGEAIYA